MKTKRQIWRRGRHLLLAASVLLSSGGALLSCSEYDLDERTPEGWGSSIYSWLYDQGNYTNTVQMINDLGYREVLAKTGSKTLFVADDAAYERFFANNSWGVRNYSQLTVSQKKLLLFGSMLDNSMQLNSLPSVQGNPPLEGESMRRFASTSEFDSVAIISPEQMPDNPYWSRLQEAGRPVVCMTDNSKVTMLQFIEKMLTNRRITNDDYNFLFNGTTNRQAGDASINGVQVAEPNIKCSNGFIHRMAEVITPLSNMAEVIKSKSNVSEYNRLLERFCAPYPDLYPDRDGSLTMEYNRLYEDRQTDTVYQKRFFSDKSQNGVGLNKSPDNGAVTTLKFDPEWNAYYAGDASTAAVQRDMAVMMVPSNQALDEYWQNGAGSILREQYHTWDNVPNDVVAELINVNMLSSFLISVPSKFASILNDANDPMGVDRADIDSVWLGCNGAVYLTNKVYSPTTFVSVLYPALTNESMKILYWAAQKCRYNVYLNSLNARYSLFIPNSNALLEYVDPVSYGKAKTQLYRFHWDPTKVSQPDRQADERVWASIWNYDPETGEVGDSIGKASFDEIRNRLKDVLDTHIVIGDVEDGKEYYQTKGGSWIRVANTSAGADGMTVAGSYQMDNDAPLNIHRVYDQTVEGNGKAYVLDSAPIMTTRKSVFDVLSEHDEFSMFRELLESSGLTERLHDKLYSTPSENLSPLNTYHYTVYVPTNESIQALIDNGKLPTWEQVEMYKEAGNEERATADSLAIVSFLRYHIQDNSLVIGGGNDDEDHETALIDAVTHRFYHVHALLEDDGLTVCDNATTEWLNENPSMRGSDEHNRRLAKVVTSSGLYNLMAREYQYNTTSPSSASMIQTSSSAVVHLIDKPLMYKE